MSKQKELDTLLRPYVENLGYECVEITFEKNGPDWVLTVYIDTPDGITLEDCETVSNVLSPLLDEHDPIEPAYLLEVSSPGIDRPLKTLQDYKRNLGEKIEVNLYQKLNGKKKLEGTVKSVEDETITISTDKEDISLDIKQISKAVPVIEF